MFSCALCSFSTGVLQNYVSHYRGHRHIHNFRFPCGINGCLNTFATYAAFHTHIYREHAISTKQASNYRSQFLEVGLSLKCKVAFCETTIEGLAGFVAHLKGHVKQGTQIDCPFLHCTKHFTKLPSFTAHLSRNHKNWSVDSVEAQYVAELNEERSTSSSNFNGNVDITAIADTAYAMDRSDDSDINADESHDADDDFTKRYSAVIGRFYMMLQGKLLVPARTVQTIVEEMCIIHDLGQENLMNNLQHALVANGITAEQSKTIVEKVNMHDVFRDLHNVNSGTFRSTHMRNKFFKSQLTYVEPIPIKLGIDSSANSVWYHYVPVKETLRVMLSDASVSAQLKNPLDSQLNIIHDVTNGSVFRNNALFCSEPCSLGIILYQDSFEVVNPIGSAKKKHKLLAVYFTLTNLYPWNRSKVEQLQLVLLCREKYCKTFTVSNVFRHMIDDLKDLELNGISYDGTVVKGTIACIAGDNLGSHYIGGFVENFATSPHFCRYCLITHKEFDARPMNASIERTTASYSEAVQHLREYPDVKVYMGIKGDSVFNELKYFNVCQPGLPPCLGHDLFEGVISYDLALFIKYFVKIKKWFTYDSFCHKVGSFNYCGNDALDKPCTVSCDGKRLGGNAVQNWCLLRLLPLIISCPNSEFGDPVWQLMLLLIRVTALVCAPKLSMGQVACMQLLIEEYLNLRSEQFPEAKMRPKHHFLLHYPALTMQFGPLIRVWTMRFEAKHSYFKRCMRYCQNFSNVTALLTERHQLLQSYLATGTLFGIPEFEVDNACPFYNELHSDEIQFAVSSYKMRHTDTVVTDRCFFKGTEFHKGQFVVITPQTDDELTIAEFLLVLIHNMTEVFFVVRTCVAHKDTELGAVRVGEASGKIICDKPNTLLIHEHPLPAYSVRNRMYVVFKYAPFDTL